MKTKITEMLGIQYPIIQGGMQWLSRAELVAAVSNAGGLGLITAASFKSKQELVEEIRKTKSLTDKPFGVNISMLPEVVKTELTEDFIDAIIDEHLQVVETSGRSPELMVPKLKAGGVKILHKVVSARFAEKAQAVGADAVIVVGYEAGGHPGMDQIGTMVNLLSTLDKVSVPVIAAGGIVDGRGMAAALAMGAQGIMMGTRFICTQECQVHQNIKEWMLQGGVTDTMIIQRSIKNAFRCINNGHANMVLGMEQAGATLKDLLPVISGGKGRKALEEGLLEGATIPMGQNVGLIHDIPTVAELINQIINEVEASYNRLGAVLK